MHVAIALLAALLTAAASRAQTVTDINLTVTPVLAPGALSQPTSMAFVGPGDFLVLEKATGRVRRVLNGVLRGTVALDVRVNPSSERGLLGGAAASVRGRTPATHVRG